MADQEIVIRVTRTGAMKWQLTASLCMPHGSARGRKMVPLKTMTRTLPNRYASELTEALLTEWVTALSLVAAGWYETPPLPFE